MGAISVVNAVACGKGASLAVKLPTLAKVDVNRRSGGWRVLTNGQRAPSPLAAVTAGKAIGMLGDDPGRYSGSIWTTTSVPVGVGLKTSSSASVAITLAVFSAFGRTSYSARDVLWCSVASSLEAGVSVTGAMDDAASCLLGGVNFADNSAGRVLSSAGLGKPMPVLIKVPALGSRRRAVPPAYLRKFSREAELIFRTGRDGNVWKAMILNGLLCCAAYGYPPGDALGALEGGAIGAGLSGTGPAVAAVFDGWSDARKLARRWKAEGAKLIRTETCDGGGAIGL